MLANFSRDYVTVDCCNCGVVFAVSKDLDKNWRENKSTFYCPNGHAQSYTKSTAEILRERVAEKDIEILELQKINGRLERRLKKK